jgi:transposase
LSRGDLTDAQWRILDPLLPDRGERGPEIENKRRTVNGIYGCCALAPPGATCRNGTAIGIRVRALLALIARVGARSGHFPFSPEPVRHYF